MSLINKESFIINFFASFDVGIVAERMHHFRDRTIDLWLNKFKQLHDAICNRFGL